MERKIDPRLITLGLGIAYIGLAALLSQCSPLSPSVGKSSFRKSSSQIDMSLQETISYRAFLTSTPPEKESLELDSDALLKLKENHTVEIPLGQMVEGTIQAGFQVDLPPSEVDALQPQFKSRLYPISRNGSEWKLTIHPQETQMDEQTTERVKGSLVGISLYLENTAHVEEIKKRLATR